MAPKKPVFVVKMYKQDIINKGDATYSNEAGHLKMGPLFASAGDERRLQIPTTAENYQSRSPWSTSWSMS